MAQDNYLAKETVCKLGAAMEKAKNAGISLYPSELETLRNQAKIRDGGSPTRYVRRLMEADAAGIMTPTAYDDQILDKLAVTYFGYHAPQFAEQLDRTQADQQATLHALLSGLSEAIACGATPDAVAIVPRWELPLAHKLYQVRP